MTGFLLFVTIKFKKPVLSEDRITRKIKSKATRPPGGRQPFSLRLKKVLIEELDAYKISTRLSRSVEIFGVAASSFIQIFLESIEDILHATVEL